MQPRFPYPVRERGSGLRRENGKGEGLLILPGQGKHGRLRCVAKNKNICLLMFPSLFADKRGEEDCAVQNNFLTSGTPGVTLGV